MEILSLIGSLIVSFIIFYVVLIATSILLFKLVFKPIPEDELIEMEPKKDVASCKKIKLRSTRKSFRPTLSIAK
jgi:hypothetical protein